MTAIDSSSSDAKPSEPRTIGLGSLAPNFALPAAGFLPPVATAVLAGRARHLLAPLTFVHPGQVPPAPARDSQRTAIAEALLVANQGYGHVRAKEMAAKLADPKTRVVVTGQQPGLFGGPLYGLSKAVAAARWAAEIEASGQPAVAVYWVATEDHDFAEVATATFLGPQGPIALELGDDLQPLLPVGLRSLGPGVEVALEALRSHFSGERQRDWIEKLAGWYRPDARFGEAFSRLYADLLGDRCPLLLDAMLPVLKREEAPLLRQLVEQRRGIAEALASRNAEIANAGLPLQVNPNPRASPLFLLRGAERRRIEWVGDAEFTLRGLDEPPRQIAELLATIDENPSVVSPGALARPAIQDAVLGTSLQVLGPGELSYMVQAASIHAAMGSLAPGVSLRPQVLVLESRQRHWLEESQLDLETLLGEPRILEQQLASRAGADLVRPVAREVLARLDTLQQPLSDLDPALDKPWERTREQVEKSLGQLAGRVAAAASRRDETLRRRVESLRTTCQPGGVLQERVLSVAHFPGKYGRGLVEALWCQMALDPAKLQLVELVGELSEEEKS